MNPAVDNRRRKIYLEGSFQSRFVLQFCALVLVGCAIFGALLYLYSARTLTTAFTHSRLRVMSTADFLLPALGFTTLIVAALVAALASLRVLALSHKIAGPIYRFEKAAQALGKGDLSQRIRLRDGDELKAFAHSLDSAVGELRGQMEEIRRHSEAIGKLLGQLDQKAPLSPKALEDLRQAHLQIDRALSRFKV